MAILGFVPWLLEPFHAFKAIVLRAIGLPLLAWYVAEAFTGRVARPGLLTLAVVGWIAVSALATVFSVSPRLSFLGELTQREGLVTTLALAGLYFASTQAHRNEAHVRTTLTVLLGAGVLAAAYAQLQLAGLDPIPWQGVHTYATEGGIALRPAGPLGNPTLLGALLAAVLPVALVRLATPGSDAARLVPAAVLLAASLVMTLSRGAWLAAAMAVIASVTAAWFAGAARRRIAWTAALSVAPAILFGAARASGPIVARLSEGVDESSLGARALIAHGAWQLWSERPWLGVGPDAFGLAFPRVQDSAFWRAEWIGQPVHAHSVPLQVLATLGMVGMLAGALWLLAAIADWVRAWNAAREGRLTLAAIAGVLAALCMAGATNVVGLAGATVFAVLTALPGAVAGRLEPARAPVAGLRAWAPWAVAAAVCVAQLVSGAREVTALTLARQTRDGPARAQATPSEWRALSTVRARAAWRAANTRPDEEVLWRIACDAALAEAEALDPAEAAPSVALAERAALRAVTLVPERASGHERLANALAARALATGSANTADSADLSYDRANRLAPVDGWLLVSWIRFHLARRAGARAHELAQRLTALYPEAAVGHTLSGAALLLLGRRTEAREELLLARGARWEEDAGAQREAVERLIAGLETKRVKKGAAGGARRQPIRRRGARRP